MAKRFNPPPPATADQQEPLKAAESATGTETLLTGFEAAVVGLKGSEDTGLLKTAIAD